MADEARRLASAVRALPIFDEDQPRSPRFKTHLISFKEWAYLFSVTTVESMKATLAFLIQGSSKDRVLHLMRGQEEYVACQTFEEYEQKMLQVFHPASETMMAKSNFHEYRQSSKQDINQFYSVKKTLFAEGYGVDGDFNIFLSGLIKGLANDVVKRGLRRANPKTFEEAATRLYEVVAAERIAFLDGYGESTSMDGLTSVTSVLDRNRRVKTDVLDAGEPMDIETIRGQGAGITKKKEQRTCYSCKRPGHIKKDCRFKSEKGAGTKTSRCNWCGYTGHWERDCRRKMAGKPRSSPKQKVQAMEDTEETEIGELQEEDLAALLAGGSVNQLGSRNCTCFVNGGNRRGRVPSQQE